MKPWMFVDFFFQYSCALTGNMINSSRCRGWNAGSICEFPVNELDALNTRRCFFFFSVSCALIGNMIDNTRCRGWTLGVRINFPTTNYLVFCIWNHYPISPDKTRLDKTGFSDVKLSTWEGHYVRRKISSEIVVIRCRSASYSILWIIDKLYSMLPYQAYLGIRSFVWVTAARAALSLALGGKMQKFSRSRDCRRLCLNGNIPLCSETWTANVIILVIDIIVINDTGLEVIVAVRSVPAMSVDDCSKWWLLIGLGVRNIGGGGTTLSAVWD